MSTTAPTPAGEPADDQEAADLEPGELATADGVRRHNAALADDNPPEGWRTHLPADEELADMTDRQREVFLSIEVHGFSPVELAELCDADPSTIRTLLAEARDARRDT